MQSNSNYCNYALSLCFPILSRPPKNKSIPKKTNFYNKTTNSTNDGPLCALAITITLYTYMNSTPSKPHFYSIAHTHTHTHTHIHKLSTPPLPFRGGRTMHLFSGGDQVGPPSDNSPLEKRKLGYHLYFSTKPAADAAVLGKKRTVLPTPSHPPPPPSRSATIGVWVGVGSGRIRIIFLKKKIICVNGGGEEEEERVSMGRAASFS